MESRHERLRHAERQRERARVAVHRHRLGRGDRHRAERKHLREDDEPVEEVVDGVTIGEERVAGPSEPQRREVGRELEQRDHPLALRDTLAERIAELDDRSDEDQVVEELEPRHPLLGVVLGVKERGVKPTRTHRRLTTTAW